MADHKREQAIQNLRETNDIALCEKRISLLIRRNQGRICHSGRGACGLESPRNV